MSGLELNLVRVGLENARETQCAERRRIIPYERPIE